MSDLRPVTVGVLGLGKVSDELVCDVLNDHFAFGPEDTDGYFGASDQYAVSLLLPATADAYGEGIEAAWQWALRCELPFTALSDGTTSARVAMVAESVLKPEDFDVVPDEDVHARLVGRLRWAPNPLLLLIPEDGRFSDELTRAAAAALECGVPVYDLTSALLEITWDDLGLTAPEQIAAQECAPPVPPALALTPPGGGDAVVLSMADVQVISITLARLLEVLEELTGMGENVPALRAAIAEAQRAVTPVSDPDPEPEAGAQAVGGDAEGDVSGADGKTRLEVWDEAAGEWKPAGRGRPKKGVQTRRVPRLRNA